MESGSERSYRHATYHCGGTFVVLSLDRAEHGGWTLLRFRRGEGKLGELFRLGAEAAVALVLTPAGWRRIILPRRKERHERSGWLRKRRRIGLAYNG